MYKQYEAEGETFVEAMTGLLEKLKHDPVNVEYIQMETKDEFVPFIIKVMVDEY